MAPKYSTELQLAKTLLFVRLFYSTAREHILLLISNLVDGLHVVGRKETSVSMAFT